MAFTLQNVADDARQYLKDTATSNNTYADALLLRLINDGIQIIRRIGSQIDQFMFASSSTIALTAAAGYGPYSLPAAFERMVRIEDSDNDEVLRGSRALSDHNDVSGEPDKYFIEGRNPRKIYFNKTPDSSYTFTYWYVPTETRAAALSETVPLDDYIREALVQWTIKMAGQVREYDTKDEDERLAIMMPLVSNIFIAGAQDIDFEVVGLSF